MSSHANHRRGHGRIQERGPRWENRNPAKGCNSTHVARSRKKWRRRASRAERRLSNAENRSKAYPHIQHHDTPNENTMQNNAETPNHARQRNAASLLCELFAGRPPAAILAGSPYFPREVGSYPQSLEIDEDGYPSENALAACATVGTTQAKRWMLEEFPRLAESMPCSSVRIEKVDFHGLPEMRIEFTTGGWSGCESFIRAVRSNFLMDHWMNEEHRGGLFVFHVPLNAKGEG